MNVSPIPNILFLPPPASDKIWLNTECDREAVALALRIADRPLKSPKTRSENFRKSPKE